MSVIPPGFFHHYFYELSWLSPQSILVYSKEEEILTLKEEFFKEKTQLEADKHKLEEEVASLKAEVEYLSHYKKGYDNLEEGENYVL